MKNSKIIKLSKTVAKHPLFSGSALLFGGGMVVNVVNYLYHLLMGRMLGPTDYGTLASLYSLLYIVSIVPISSSVAVVKFVSSAETKFEQLEIYLGIKRFIFKIAFVSMMVLLLLSPLISQFLNIKSIVSVAMVGPIMFLLLITLVNQSTLQGLLRFIGVIGPNFVSSIIKLVFGVAFVLMGYAVLGAMWAVLMAAVFAYIYSWYLVRGFVVHKKNKNIFNLTPFLKFSLPVLLQALAFTSIFTTDQILVKHFFPEFEAGLYAAISTLGKIIFFAASPVASAMFPVVASRFTKKEKYRKLLLVSLSVTTVISFAIVGGYFLFPNLAITMLYGSKYLSASRYLAWMGLFIALYSISNFIVNFFLSIGKTKVVFLPLTLCFVQIVGIWFYHDSLMSVIGVSLIITTILTVGLLVLLVQQLRQL